MLQPILWPKHEVPWTHLIVKKNMVSLWLSQVSVLKYLHAVRRMTFLMKSECIRTTHPRLCTFSLEDLWDRSDSDWLLKTSSHLSGHVQSDDKVQNQRSAR